MLLDGKRALITGGLTGIGAALAEHFVKEGAFVTVASRRAERHDLTPQDATRKVVDHVDVRDSGSVRAAFNRAVQRWDGLDIVVACAGVVRHAKADSLDRATFADMIETNLIGTHNTVRAGARALRKAGGGHILTLSSAITRTPMVGTAAFAATKAAIEAYTATAAIELAERNIRLNCLAPGVTDTGLGRALIADKTRWPAYREHIALARPGDRDEIAKAAAWLVSPANSYMIGETVHVNGGLHVPLTRVDR